MMASGSKNRSGLCDLVPKAVVVESSDPYGSLVPTPMNPKPQMSNSLI